MARSKSSTSNEVPGTQTVPAGSATASRADRYCDGGRKGDTARSEPVAGSSALTLGGGANPDAAKRFVPSKARPNIGNGNGTRIGTDNEARRWDEVPLARYPPANYRYSDGVYDRV